MYSCCCPLGLLVLLQQLSPPRMSWRLSMSTLTCTLSRIAYILGETLHGLNQPNRERLDSEKKQEGRSHPAHNCSLVCCLNLLLKSSDE